MDMRKLIYQNSVIAGNDQWFWSENCNALFQRDLEKGTVRRIGQYENYENAAYTKLVLYKNKLIGLPNAAGQIMIYDISQKEFRYTGIGIREMEGDSGNHEKFFGAVVRENWLFMIGCRTAHVLKFDMEAELAAGYVDLYAGLVEKKNGMGCLREGVIRDNQIFIPALYDNYVFKINTDDLQYSKLEIDKKSRGFSTVYMLEDQLWLFPFDKGEIIQWNDREEIIVRHDIRHLMSLRRNTRNFLSAYRINNKLWILPRLGNKVLSYDLITCQFSNRNAVNLFFKKENKMLIGIAAEKLGEKLLFLTDQVDELILFDPEKDEIKLIANEMPDLDYLKFLKTKKEKLILFEKDIRLTAYRDFLCEM